MAVGMDTADFRKGKIMSKLVIKFTSGADVGKELIFDITEVLTLSVGRDSSCDIVVQDGEATVSRKHADIKVMQGGSVYIADANSKHGLLVNNKKITGESPLNQDDLVRFGVGGPVISITFDPPRAKATREINLGELQKETREYVVAAPTREMATLASDVIPSGSPSPSNSSAKQGIGKETLEREVFIATDKVRKESGKKMTNALMLGAAAVVLIGGISYFYYEKQQVQRTDEVRRDMKNELDRLGGQIVTANQDIGVTIKNEWGPSVVQIETSWRVVDEKGSPLYHALIDNKKLYRRTKDGGISLVLTSSENAHPVIGTSTGSGFVVTAAGHIMTNQHVAAGWTAAFGGSAGVLQGQDGNIESVDFQPNRELFIDRNLLTGKGLAGSAIGQNLAMFVVFPNSNIRVPATLGVMSPEHDVAVIKIDAPGNLKPLEFGGSANFVAGSKVYHLGYPGLSQNNIQVQQTKDSASARQVTTSQDVSISEGTVSKVVPRVASTATASHWLSDTGDYIEIDISSGQGSSGAPLFDKNGKVVGIVTSRMINNNQTANRFTLAVPSSYGIRLLNPTSPSVNK